MRGSKGNVTVTYISGVMYFLQSFLMTPGCDACVFESLLAHVHEQQCSNG